MANEVVFSSVWAKLLGSRVALKLGLAVEIVGGQGDQESTPCPQGRSHDSTEDSPGLGDRGSADEVSKIDTMRIEWEQFRNESANG